MRKAMGKSGHSRKAGLLTIAAFGLLLAYALGLTVQAGRAAPAGCSLRAITPAETACFPLESTQWWVSDGYGWRNDPFTGKKAFHRGIDLACAEGTPVRAVMGGVVASARYSGSYGNVLRLCHDGGQETIYAHLQYLYVRSGEVVQAGALLGTAGQTGRATGVHLHLELLSGGTVYAPSVILEKGRR